MSKWGHSPKKVGNHCPSASRPRAEGTAFEKKTKNKPYELFVGAGYKQGDATLPATSGRRCSTCGAGAGSGLTRPANAALAANCEIRMDSENHRKRVQNPVYAFPSEFLENNTLAGSGGSGSLSCSRDKVSTGETRDSSGSTSSSNERVLLKIFHNKEKGRLHETYVYWI